jgi:hypothetical protein
MSSILFPGSKWGVYQADLVVFSPWHVWVLVAGYCLVVRGAAERLLVNAPSPSRAAEGTAALAR